MFGRAADEEGFDVSGTEHDGEDNAEGRHGGERRDGAPYEDASGHCDPA